MSIASDLLEDLYVIDGSDIVSEAMYDDTFYQDKAKKIKGASYKAMASHFDNISNSLESILDHMRNNKIDDNLWRNEYKSMSSALGDLANKIEKLGN